MPTFTHTSYLSAVFNVVGISILLWVVAILIRRTKNNLIRLIAQIGFLIALLFPGNYIRLVLKIDTNVVYWVTDNFTLSLIIGSVVVAASFFVLIFHLRLVVKCAYVAILIISPFGFFAIGQAAWKAGDALRQSDSVPSPVVQRQSVPSNKGHQRVLWLIFDELDLRLAFTDRPSGIDLPHFDQFRQQALFGLNPRSHSKDTELAIPSYITGKLVNEVDPISPNQLNLRFESDAADQPWVNWGEARTFFSQAHDLGSKNAIIGMYHPYCRVFSTFYSFCFWQALNTFSPQTTNSLAAEMFSQIRGVTPLYRRINGISIYKNILRTAVEAASNSEYDVVYVHASVPHGPDIFDAQSRKFTLFNLSKVGYFENLMLADQFLGTLRRSMEESELWEKTTILITSDHEWRHVYLYDNNRVRKVPFLLKMSYQKTPFVYEPAFSPMTVSKDLLLEILAGNLTDSPAVVEWLGARVE